MFTVRYIDYHTKKKTEDGTKAVPFVQEVEVPDVRYGNGVFYFLDSDKKPILMIPLNNLISLVPSGDQNFKFS